MKFSKVLIPSLLALISMSAMAGDPPQCKQSKVENSNIEMCMLPGAAFQHDLYTLKLDKTLILALVDDYVEDVKISHTIPEGVSMEFPLSKQGMNPVQITGGCVPVSKDGLEVARVCNFTWGNVQIVKDVRFEFN